MKHKTSPLKFMTISSIAILLSMITVVMGAPLMRLLRKNYGALPYWTTGFLITLFFWLVKAEPVALFVSATWVTLGMYCEFEQKGFRWFSSAVLSVLIGSLFSGLGLFKILKINGIETMAALQTSVDEFARKVETINPNVKIDTTYLIQQTPSVIAIMLILALGLGLIFERRVFTWLNLPRVKTASQLNLLDYRVPDFIIWIAMSAFLLTMVSFGVKAIAILALNIVNVAIVLYFFQGLAVLEVFLNSIKAGTLTRVMTYIFLIGQLLLLLSLVGLIDYWVDFRRRINNLKARAAENN